MELPYLWRGISRVSKSGIIPPQGPLDAKICWLGEHPYTYGILDGKWMVDQCLRAEGLDPEKVYWTNVLRVNPGKFPANEKLAAKAVKSWAKGLDEEFRSLTQCKVVVACGPLALQRMTGYGWTGITDWAGSVLRREDVEDEMVWWQALRGAKEEIKHLTVWPVGSVVIPCLHPAGIISTPNRDSYVLLRRAVNKVARFLQGRLRGVEFVLNAYPSVEEVRGVTKSMFYL